MLLIFAVLSYFVREQFLFSFVRQSREPPKLGWRQVGPELMRQPIKQLNTHCLICHLISAPTSSPSPKSL